MSFQQCRFNFGADEFKYPPKRPFSVFNDFGTLKPQDKVCVIKLIHQSDSSLKNDFTDCLATTFVSRRVEKAERDRRLLHFMRRLIGLYQTHPLPAHRLLLQVLSTTAVVSNLPF